MTPIHKQILLVEDDLGTRMLCKKTLLRHGWHCLEAESIAEAIAYLSDESISLDLILLDFGLPDGEPWAVLKMSKRTLRSIPVIVATGMGDEKLASKCIGKGAVDYIIKNGNYWELLPPAIERAIAVNQAINDASRLAAIVSASPDPMYALNTDGIIQSWNPAAERLFGHSSAEAEGQSILAFVDEKYHPRLQRAIDKASRGKETRLKSIHITKLGDAIPTSSAISPIIGNELVPNGIAVVERDLRPQLQADALKEKTQTLLKINQELDQFAAVVAHDLQSPLGTASLQIDLLAQQYKSSTDSADSQLYDTLNATHQLIKRSCSMIDRILQYARESNVDTSHDTIINMRSVCDSAVHGIDAMVRETQAQVTVNDLPHACFDELQLVRIFQNLICNAIKYRNSERRPQINIEESEPRNPHFITIDVIDNSKGISVQQSEAIFTLYKRGDADQHSHQDSNAPSGTGIGLAVCRKLIEARGGSLTLHQSSAAGSTFRCTIPRPSSMSAEDQSGAHLKM